MNQNESHSRAADNMHSTGYWSFILLPMLALVLYVLSIGPVMRMRADNFFPAGTGGLLSKFYSPVSWAYWETPLHKPLGMYFHMWVPTCCATNGEFWIRID